MKKNIIYTFMAAGVMLSASCSKNFLTDPKPTQSISSVDVYATDAGVRGYFNGMYSYLRSQYGANGTTGGSTDAWGITAVNLARVVKGADVPISNSWYYFDYQNDNREPTYRRTVFTWRFFYELANQANNLIAGVQSSGSLTAASKAAFLAEARAFRAWCYFELVREFSHAYAQDQNAPGVPIYTEPTTPTTQGKPRGTVKQVYDFILKELTEALPDIPSDRQMKDVINEDVVNGLLARVSLEVGNWPDAIKYAQAARAGYTLAPAEYAPMIDIAADEVMWGFPQSADQSVYYGSPSAFWGGSGSVSGYYNFFIDSNFVRQFTPTDARRKFVQTTATDYRKFRTTKFGTATNFTDHIIAMRSPEMYLIEAEAKARNNDATAATVLFELQKNRDASATASGNTGQALINEILLERRKELYGELGIDFLDAKRLQLPLVRGTGHPTLTRITLTANDPKFTLKIPQTEFDANVSLKPTDQNP